MERYICLHGHFYQPPRESPWLEHVETQDSAVPYHDWNEKITAECYAPNASCRILDPGRKIIDIVNNYAKISFNFGPTLLTWMERKQPELYQAIQQADKLSQQYFHGHGAAIAQVYNHLIMPLANKHDKETQVIWGIRNFMYHFGRKPEGMWLAETAVDIETLEVLAEHGIAFTILAPRQARRIRKNDDHDWLDVSGGKIDPRRPYRCNLPSGKNIALFFYDGHIAQDSAFGRLLSNGEAFAKRLCATFADTEQPQLAHVAVDGETYGHHHRHGDMTLAYCLYYLESQQLAKVTVYGAYLAKYPPVYEVEVCNNSSWSCSHGIERWRSDCGCNSGGHPGWSQSWRAPLRSGLDWLRDTLQVLYEEGTAGCLDDPWSARNDYIEVIMDRSPQQLERFWTRHAAKPLANLANDDKIKMLKLLEMQRNALLMYTSCGWFFDEISGIETVQIMRYAARAIQFAGEAMQMPLEDAFVKILELSPSNMPYFNNGADVYQALVKPSVVDLLRVGAHYAIASLFENYDRQETIAIYSYQIKQEAYERVEAGKQKLVVGRAKIRSEITTEEAEMSFAVLHLGDHNLNGGVRFYLGPVLFATMLQEIKHAFERRDVPGILRIMDHHFGMHNYSLWHLFRDEQRKIMNEVFANTLSSMEAALRQIYENHYPMAQVLHEVQMPFPKVLKPIIEFILNADLRKLLEAENPDMEQLRKLIVEFGQHSVELDKNSLQPLATSKIVDWMQQLAQHPEDTALLQNLLAFLKIIQPLNLRLEFWKAQNIFFAIGKAMKNNAQTKADAEPAWWQHFHQLGYYLNARSL